MSTSIKINTDGSVSNKAAKVKKSDGSVSWESLDGKSWQINFADSPFNSSNFTVHPGAPANSGSVRPDAADKDYPYNVVPVADKTSVTTTATVSASAADVPIIVIEE